MLSAALQARGLRPRVIFDPPRVSEVFDDRELLSECRCVVVVGGDGTAADVINGLQETAEGQGVALGVLPAGNENLLARCTGFSGDVAKLTEAITDGRSRRMDLGRVGPRCFSIMVSVGVDAGVVHELARWRESGRGLRRVTRLSYVKPTLSTLRGYGYPMVHLEVEGERWSGVMAAVCNLSRYGPQFRLAPDATAEDGMLDWVVFEKPGVWNVGRYLWALCRGKHLKLPDVRHGRAQSVRISSDGEVPVQADGDPMGMTPVEMDVLPGALRVVEM